MSRICLLETSTKLRLVRGILPHIGLIHKGDEIEIQVASLHRYHRLTRVTSRMASQVRLQVKDSSDFDSDSDD